ncbi:molecular chaperone DnaJ [Pelagibius litoralis]|uniref:Molecular chaperone DnaJ n=1 Tax=Pelagibius litoralis TaxID=374515 RepID=A0A967F361_9PROT|nr:molecular chaperone DnaJ [Pelagibius litoralis]NIA72339.1 molecular chaperone DnaJ [Pelagibius litoralis]
MPYFFLGIALLAAALLAARWFVDAEPKKVATALKIGGGVLLGLVTLALVLAGRISLLMMLYAGLYFLRRTLRAGGRRAQAMNGPSPGQSSEVRTRFLQMVLDHDSGEMDGEVLDGRFMGTWLSQLGPEELLQLLDDYEREDPQSASVLEAYLDRSQAEGWRERAQGGAGAHGGAGGGPESPREGPMSRDEALEILGLQDGATAVQIREAHRRLMQKIHPDHGGSNYLAAKLNEAKDLLLGT